MDIDSAKTVLDLGCGTGVATRGIIHRTNFIESFRKLIPHSGTMTGEQINTWADARLKESEDGIFFGACNYYSYVAKPW